VTGCIDPSTLDRINSDDDGGQYDSSGGSFGNGNPQGSACLGFGIFLPLFLLHVPDPFDIVSPGITTTSNSSNPPHLERALDVAMIRTTAQLTTVRTTLNRFEFGLILVYLSPFRQTETVAQMSSQATTLTVLESINPLKFFGSTESPVSSRCCWRLQYLSEYLSTTNIKLDIRNNMNTYVYGTLHYVTQSYIALSRSNETT
jgi:hypothetical protein